LRILQYLIAASLLAFLLRSCDFDQLAKMVSEVRLSFLFAVALLVGLSTALGAIAILVLLGPVAPTAWIKFSNYYCYIQAICQITPAQAAEVALPYFAAQISLAPGQVTAALVIQRMVGVAINVVVALMGASQWVNSFQLWLAVLAIGGLFIIVLSIIHNSAIRARMNQAIGHRLGPVLFGFYEAWIRIFRERKTALAVHVTIMMMRFAISVFTSLILLRAFGVGAAFPELATLSALATIAALVPISFGGIGVTEGIFVAGLTGFGYETERIVAALLLGRLLAILTLMIWPIAFWTSQKRLVREISRHFLFKPSKPEK